MSAVLATGGAAAVHEAFQQADREAIEHACQLPQNLGAAACRDVLPSAELARNAHTARDVYGWIGGVLLVGGALGIYGSFVDVSLAPETERVAVPSAEPEAETE